jgi:erythromycin esterase-like protein
MEIKPVRPSLEGSQEALCHEVGLPRFLLDLRGYGPADVREALLTPRLERFIGVIYRPATERWSHYSETILARQFDAWAWFDETEAVTPLAGADEGAGEDDLWPFGL